MTEDAPASPNPAGEVAAQVEFWRSATVGPDGYTVIAVHDVNLQPVDERLLWSIDHVTRCHGWSRDDVQAAMTAPFQSRYSERHHQEHETPPVLRVPHIHAEDALECVVARSALHPEVRTAVLMLLGYVRSVNGGEDYWDNEAV